MSINSAQQSSMVLSRWSPWGMPEVWLLLKVFIFFGKVSIAICVFLHHICGQSFEYQTKKEFMYRLHQSQAPALH